MQSLLIYAFLLLLVPSLIQASAHTDNGKAVFESTSEKYLLVDDRAESPIPDQQLLALKHTVKAAKIGRLHRRTGTFFGNRNSSVLTIFSNLPVTGAAGNFAATAITGTGTKKFPLWLIYCTLRL